MDDELDDEEAGVINGVKRLLVTERAKADAKIGDLEGKIDKMDKNMHAIQQGTDEKIDRLEAMMQAILNVHASQMTDAERVAAEEQRRAEAHIAAEEAEAEAEAEGEGEEEEEEEEPEPEPEPEP